MTDEATLRYLFARAHAQRLFAAAYAADAEAARLCPWMPQDFRTRDAACCKATADRHLDRAAEYEREAVTEDAA